MASGELSSSLTELCESDGMAGKAEMEDEELGHEGDGKDEISEGGQGITTVAEAEAERGIDLPVLRHDGALSNDDGGELVEGRSGVAEVPDSEEDEVVSPAKDKVSGEGLDKKAGKEPEEVRQDWENVELQNRQEGDVHVANTIRSSEEEISGRTAKSEGGKIVEESVTEQGALPSTNGPSRDDVDSMGTFEVGKDVVLTKAPALGKDELKMIKEPPSQNNVGHNTTSSIHPSDATPPAENAETFIAKSEPSTYTPARQVLTPKLSSTGSKGAQNNEVLMAELKAIKIASIQARNAALEAEIASKRAMLEEVTKKLKSPAAGTVKRHIKLLHDYNDVRDVGQGLVGMIADNRGVRIGELYEEFGVGLKD